MLASAARILAEIDNWRLGVLSGSFLLAVAGYLIVSRLLGAWARRTDTPIDDRALQLLRPPVRVLLPAFGLLTAWPAPEGKPLWGALRHALVVLFIAGCGWLVVRGLRVLEMFALDHYRSGDRKTSVHARAARTQLRGFRNILSFLVIFATVAVALMTFGPVRRLGMSLLASAGVASVVIGFAAQQSIATLLAGIQIAITQPIRVDDVVIVEGEWGTIDEITLTYVVVRIWDERRLVVPMKYFIEKPIENWTRSTTTLVGTVYLFADYTVPVDALRGELERVCKASEHWDGRSFGLVITNAKEHVLELRATVSAADSSHAWSLRCEVREALVTFMRDHHPESLPRFRAELRPDDHAPALSGGANGA
ncbi:MAG: mechanosensitive ion channel [Myxococcales bacterium]|nr:mechanosensitive ion channel [Myxococcales bacterium]